VDITFKNLSVHLQKKLESKKGKKPEVLEKPETIPEVRYVLFYSAANVFGPSGSRSIRRRYPGTDPDPVLVLLTSSKNSKKNPDSYCFVTS
jgi:hypothetical protein